MAEITFTREQTDRIVDLIQAYFSEKLDSDIGRFDAEFLLDFFQKEIGVYFYNQALQDAQTLLMAKFEELGDTLQDLEKWTPP